MGNCEDEEATGVKQDNTTTINQGPGDDTVVIICNIFCFHGDTIVEVLEEGKLKAKRISEVKIGDYVLTYNGKEEILTRVKENIENKGLFSFYEIKCKDENSNIKSICVTWNHTMIVYEKSKYEITFKYASQLKIGDLFRTKLGFFKIFEINKKMMNDCYQMTVENGTVLANDILLTTIYLNKNNSNKIYQKVLESAKFPIQNLN